MKFYQVIIFVCGFCALQSQEVITELSVDSVTHISEKKLTPADIEKNYNAEAEEDSKLSVVK